MTKAELVAAMAEKTGLNRAQAKDALEAFIHSVTSTLNWALSAITKNPHASASGAMIHHDAPNANPIVRAHNPLASMAKFTSFARPIRSATRPPQMQPAPPTAMTAKPTTAANRACGTSPLAAALAASCATRNAGIHVQYE